MARAAESTVQMQQRELVGASEGREASGRSADPHVRAAMGRPIGFGGGPAQEAGGSSEPPGRIVPVGPGDLVGQDTAPAAPAGGDRGAERRGALGVPSLAVCAAVEPVLPTPLPPPALPGLPGLSARSVIPLAPHRSSAHVPSEELWHAAIRAALQAAETAADLRRSLLRAREDDVGE